MRNDEETTALVMSWAVSIGILIVIVWAYLHYVDLPTLERLLIP